MSSDSEDDFYGNMTERLQKEKDKIIEDKTETLNLFDDSGELDEIVKNNKLPAKTTKKRTRKDLEDTPSCSTTDLPEVAVGSPSKSPPKRLTRSRAKRRGASGATASADEVPNTNKRKKTSPRRPQGSDEDEGDKSGSIFGDIVSPRARGRGRARGRARGGGRGRARTPRRRNRSSGWFWGHRDADLLDLPLGSDDDEDDGGSDDDEESGSIFGNIVAPRASRGRRGWGRGRARAPRRRNHSHGHFWAPRGANLLDILQLMFPQRNRGIQSWDPTIPTYSVGNTEDYEDQSHNQPLFSNTNKEKQKPDNVVDMEEDNDNNEELSVKVYWQSSEFFKFSIRKFQKLTQIFDYFAKKENVTQDKLLFMYNDRILSPDDTPDAIEYNIVKFIDGGIVTQGVIDQINKDKTIKNGIMLKFQAQNLKKPIEVTIREEDKLSVAMMKCSEVLEQPLDRLKFIFDGDSISGKSTARELEFEGGECIDVRIIS